VILFQDLFSYFVGSVKDSFRKSSSSFTGFFNPLAITFSVAGQKHFAGFGTVAAEAVTHGPRFSKLAGNNSEENEHEK